MRALDLGIPIGALDQPDHDPPVAIARECGDRFHHDDSPLLIGLDDNAKPGPILQVRIARQTVEQLERQHGAVRFFSINREVQIMARRYQRQPLEPGIKLGKSPRLLHGFKPGVECG